MNLQKAFCRMGKYGMLYRLIENLCDFYEKLSKAADKYDDFFKKRQYLLNIIAGLMIGMAIIFANMDTQCRKEGRCGYRTDYKERVDKIFREIPIIIEPYHLASSKSYTRGTMIFAVFEIKNIPHGDIEQVNAVLNDMKKKATQFGFIGGVCRDDEELFTSVSWANGTVDKITLKWKYPAESCIKQKSKPNGKHA